MLLTLKHVIGVLIVMTVLTVINKLGMGFIRNLLAKLPSAVRYPVVVANRFWKKVLAHATRFIFLGVILALHGGFWPIFWACVLSFVDTCWFAKIGLIQNIKWDEKKTQRLTTAICAVLAIMWVLREFRLLFAIWATNKLHMIVFWIAILGLAILIISFIRRANGTGGKTSNEEESHQEEVTTEKVDD